MLGPRNVPTSCQPGEMSRPASREPDPHVELPERPPEPRGRPNSSAAMAPPGRTTRASSREGRGRILDVAQEVRERERVERRGRRTAARRRFPRRAGCGRRGARRRSGCAQTRAFPRSGRARRRGSRAAARARSPPRPSPSPRPAPRRPARSRSARRGTASTEDPARARAARSSGHSSARAAKRAPVRPVSASRKAPRGESKLARGAQRGTRPDRGRRRLLTRATASELTGVVPSLAEPDERPTSAPSPTATSAPGSSSTTPASR